MSFRLVTALFAGTAVSACVATPDPHVPAAAQRVLDRGSGSSPVLRAGLPVRLCSWCAPMLPQAAPPSRRRRSELPRPRRVRSWMTLWSQHCDAAAMLRPQRCRRAVALGGPALRHRSGRRAPRTRPRAGAPLAPVVVAHRRAALLRGRASDERFPGPAARPVPDGEGSPEPSPAPTCQRRRVVCQLARRRVSHPRFLRGAYTPSRPLPPCTLRAADESVTPAASRLAPTSGAAIVELARRRLVHRAPRRAPQGAPGSLRALEP